MKKIIIPFLAIIASCAGMGYVDASENEVYFTNMNGVKLTEKEYNNLLRGFSHDTINTMDEEMINGI